MNPNTTTRFRRRAVLPLAIALSAVLGLAACGTSTGDGSADGSANEAKQVRLFMAPKFTGLAYFEVARKGGEDAAKATGDSFTYVGSDKPDVSEQVRTLQNAITQKPDALIVSAIDDKAVAPALKQARQRGVKVVTYDADAAVDARDIFVNQLTYELAAKTMLDAALQNDPSGGKVAFISASPTAPNHTAHVKIMKELMTSDPKYQVFKPMDTVQFAGDDEAKSFDIAVNLMQSQPDLKYIISSSAVSVPAAARAVAGAAARALPRRVGTTWAGRSRISVCPMKNRLRISLPLSVGRIWWISQLVAMGRVLQPTRAQTYMVPGRSSKPSRSGSMKRMAKRCRAPPMYSST